MNILRVYRGFVFSQECLAFFGLVRSFHYHPIRTNQICKFQKHFRCSFNRVLRFVPHVIHEAHNGNDI